tara:strand:- start:2040 stop:2327 length:288 start_codon:yes stop_codon:yes gene_type:complete
MEKAVVIKAVDNVATCLADMTAGETATIRIDDRETVITLQNDISFGHKVALTDIAKGGKILKYAEVIGIASQAITMGEHVHIHNVESIRARGDKA